ncbi:hypothetical protein [Botrimarina sp.]|uniref:hypothetical protein n=1 Tax=Botrimarina sp. TaxID=2795802 RepID=UPI0032EE55D9
MLRVTTFRLAAAALVSLGPSADQSLASGVGASIYVTARKADPKVKPASHAAPASHPATASHPAMAGPPVPGCVECGRHGFACMKHIGVTPCMPEGACVPNRDSFGYTATRWRKWPGVVYDDGREPRPAELEEDGGLLDDVDEPAPTEEDRQAPPPIDTANAPGEEGEEGVGPGGGEFPFEPGAPGEPGGRFEFDLPAAPGGANGPFQPPRPVAPGFRDQPARPGATQPAPGAQPNAPPLPPFEFGGAPRRGSVADGAPPRLPFSSRPAAAVKTTPSDDAPPPLPEGFTRVLPGALLRRLPGFDQKRDAAPRYDAAVQPVSAAEPVR